MPVGAEGGAGDDRATRARGRVLVIDDEPSIGAALKRWLGRDHDVVYESSARAGLARIERGEQYDLVLCDVRMPEMSGPDFRDELARRGSDHHGRVVFMTGGELDGVDASSAPPVLYKPFAPDDLQRLIGRALAAREREG